VVLWYAGGIRPCGPSGSRTPAVDIEASLKPSWPRVYAFLFDDPKEGGRKRKARSAGERLRGEPKRTPGAGGTHPQ